MGDPYSQQYGADWPLRDYLTVRKYPGGFRHLLAAHLPDLGVLRRSNNDPVLPSRFPDDSCRPPDEINVLVPELQLNICVLSCLQLRTVSATRMVQRAEKSLGIAAGDSVTECLQAYPAVQVGV